ncbi:MAG: hypothetical protein ABIJ50_11690 [Pseudomonadota bacterium]
MKKSNKSILGYKQAPGCKVWEVLPILSLEKVEHATNPEANGLKDGSRNHPSAASAEVAETETRILYQAEEYLAGVNDIATKEMTDIGRQVGDCAVNRADAFADLEASAEKEFQHYILQAQPELQKLRVEERRQLRDFKLFKAKNGLDRLASYPESRWFHAALVAIAILVECGANTYFFAAGSELGLLGGFLQAMLISAANVATSLYVGRLALSNLHHVNRLRVTAGGLGFSLWIVLICLYHLMVAHYRDMLSIDLEQAISSAMDRFITSPFHLESLDSVLVLVIGLVISIFALIEGYRFDDTYPGYGEEDRKYRQKQRAYEAKDGEVRTRMAASIRDAEMRVKERLNAYEEKDAKMTDLLSGAISVVDHFDNIYSQVDDIISAAVNKYRAANRKIRTDADPDSFSTMPQARRVLEIENFRKQLDEFRDIKEVSTILLQKIHEHAAKVQGTLADRTGAMLKRIEQLAEDVSNKADKEISYLNQEV